MYDIWLNQHNLQMNVKCLVATTLTDQFKQYLAFPIGTVLERKKIIALSKTQSVLKIISENCLGHNT